MAWFDLLDACGEGLDLLLWAGERRWRIVILGVLIAALILLVAFGEG